MLDCCPCRGVAQSGSAPVWGTGGRRFKSGRPDHFRTCTGPGGFVPTGALSSACIAAGHSGSCEHQGPALRSSSLGAPDDNRRRQVDSQPGGRRVRPLASPSAPPSSRGASVCLSPLDARPGLERRARPGGTRRAPRLPVRSLPCRQPPPPGGDGGARHPRPGALRSPPHGHGPRLTRPPLRSSQRGSPPLLPLTRPGRLGQPSGQPAARAVAQAPQPGLPPATLGAGQRSLRDSRSRRDGAMPPAAMSSQCAQRTSKGYCRRANLQGICALSLRARSVWSGRPLLTLDRRGGSAPPSPRKASVMATEPEAPRHRLAEPDATDGGGADDEREDMVELVDAGDRSTRWWATGPGQRLRSAIDRSRELLRREGR